MKLLELNESTRKYTGVQGITIKYMYTEVLEKTQIYFKVFICTLMYAERQEKKIILESICMYK